MRAVSSLSRHVSPCGAAGRCVAVSTDGVRPLGRSVCTVGFPRTATDGPRRSRVPVGAENLCQLAGCSADRWLLGAPSAGSWDDLRLVGLKLIFLIATRAVSLLGLSRREDWWKDAEILMLRHQLAVAQRQQPRAHSRLTWPDRAWLALLAGTVPAERLAAMRLIVTPGTILRWQRDIVRRRWARLSRRGRSGRPATHRRLRAGVLRLARENESWDTGGSTVSSRGSASRWRRPRSGRSSRAPGSTGLRAGVARTG